MSRARRIVIKRPVVRVTKSGRMFCNRCGRWNHVPAGYTNPRCGHCGQTNG